MNSRTIINDELQSIAPQLINAPVTMPYTLPSLYFEQLPVTVLSLINEEDTLLTNLSKEIPYQIPAGYFDQFAQSVLLKIRGSNLTPNQQHNKLLPLSDFPRQMPYTVPKGYFDILPTIMLGKIAAPKQQTVPANYFDSLPEILLSKVRQLDATNELDEVAPLLNTISRNPVQHVPQGYFENLQPVLEETKAAPMIAPVISLQKKTNWLKYAVAASVVLILSWSAYFTFNSHKSVAPSIANQPTATVINNQLASLDASTIENYLQADNATTQTAFSVDDLDKLNNSDIDELLQDFTDQQLKKHIEETPELPTVNNAKKPV